MRKLSAPEPKLRISTAAWASFASLGLLAGLPEAAHADYWAYTTDSGTRAYTDDRDAIPERYRHEAVLEKSEPLTEYKRSSTILRHPDMRSLNARHEETRRGEQTRTPNRASTDLPRERGVMVDLGGGVEVEVKDSGEAPLRVERNVHRWEGGRLHRYTVVKQGDKTLAEIRDTPAGP